MNFHGDKTKNHPQKETSKNRFLPKELNSAQTIFLNDFHFGI